MSTRGHGPLPGSPRAKDTAMAAFSVSHLHLEPLIENDALDKLLTIRLSSNNVSLQD
jgi:hypothetical protein